MASPFTDIVDNLGFTAHWRFNETSGTTIYDRIGGDDLTLGTAPTLSATGGGADGDDGVDFPGDGGTENWAYIDFATDGVGIDLDIRADRTMVVIFKHDDTGYEQMLYQIGGRESGIFINQYFGNLYVNGCIDRSNVFSGVVTSAISVDTWYMVTVVMDTAADEVYVYKNDSLIMTIDISSLPSDAFSATGQNVTFGDAQGGGTGGDGSRAVNGLNTQRIVGLMDMNGIIDEAAYGSGVVLSPEEVSTLYDVWLNGIVTYVPSITYQAVVPSATLGELAATSSTPNIENQAQDATSLLGELTSILPSPSSEIQVVIPSTTFGELISTATTPNVEIQSQDPTGSFGELVITLITPNVEAQSQDAIGSLSLVGSGVTSSIETQVVESTYTFGQLTIVLPTPSIETQSQDTTFTAGEATFVLPTPFKTYVGVGATQSGGDPLVNGNPSTGKIRLGTIHLGLS